MTRHWRSLGFVALALLLVLLVQDLSVKNRVVPSEQVGGGSVVPPPTAKASEKVAERLLAGPVTEIPLYEGGDLPARRPTKKKLAKTLSTTKIQLSPVKSVPRRRPAPMKTPVIIPETTASLEGSEEAVRPVLVASYDQIGFSRYLEVVESVGRFFVLLKREGSAKIGPPVSLARRTTLPRDQNPTAGLAIERPHLVRDRDVRRRLQEMHLPTNAYSDRIALLFRVRFDRTLWFAVGNALHKKKLALRQVEEVKGHYILRSGSIYLEFDSALLKEDGGYVLLSDVVRVAL